MTAPTGHGLAARRLWPAAAIVVIALFAYGNSFSVPFLFDDQPSIVDNPTLQNPARIWAALSPPRGQGITVEGRPALNVSLAINHALSGTAVWGYHATNLAIHIVAALALFGIVRRTLRQPMLATRCGEIAMPVAFAVAAIWVAHPLQTESVTYVVQRAESLMGMLYLLTLYSFIRGATGEQRTRWFTLTVAICACGMATKEVMVTAPLVVLLYDRTFVSGSFGAAWRRHGALHLGLIGTWIILAFLVAGAGDRGGTIGAGAGVTWWQYALSQSRGVIHYIQLALWPHPLVFDYGTDFVSAGEVVPYAILDLVLLGLTWFALWRAPAAGFLGACFFLILAPTTSVVGGTRQMLAEHRMYLSLAALIALGSVGLYAVLGRRSFVFLAAGLIAFGILTLRRNADYRTELGLYADTVTKRPNNPFARYNYGKALAEAGHLEEAIVQDREAVRLRPGNAGAQNNLGKALGDLGRFDEAMTHYQSAVQLEPTYAKAHYNLGVALIQLRRPAEALPHFETAVRLNPADVEARDNWGSALLERGDTVQAEEQFRRVLALNPNLAEAHCNLGTALLLQQKYAAAEEQFEVALRINPQFSVARERLQLAQARALQGKQP